MGSIQPPVCDTAECRLEITGHVLRTTPRSPVPPGLHMPIDRFLRSLAQECGGRSIAVILSGSGRDGAAGLEAVKAAGGVTFAQDPRTAEFDSMPRTAAGSGLLISVAAGRHRRGVDQTQPSPVHLG